MLKGHDIQIFQSLSTIHIHQELHYVALSPSPSSLVQRRMYVHITFCQTCV